MPSNSGLKLEVPHSIEIEDPSQPDIVALLEQGERHSAELYPAQSNHHLSLEALRASNISFFVARDRAGRAIGTGAVVLQGDWAEIKRMWVEPDARGRGLSTAILKRLEVTARALGARFLRLETGASSHAALALYAGAGFIPCDPFADYRPDPVSVFLQKDLHGGITVEPSRPDLPEAVALIDALSDLLFRQYGSDGRASFQSWADEADRSVFALAYSSGVAIACGAIRPLEVDVAEVKRMYATPGYPGAGSAVLRFLEREAGRLGYRLLRLETRWANERAVRFYRKHGYAVCPNYGSYAGRAESACFEKRLV